MNKEVRRGPALRNPTKIRSARPNPDATSDWTWPAYSEETRYLVLPHSTVGITNPSTVFLIAILTEGTIVVTLWYGPGSDFTRSLA